MNARGITVGDQVRIRVRRAEAHRQDAPSARFHWSDWTEVVGLDGHGNVQVKVTLRAKTPSGGVATARKWVRESDVWTEEDEREGGKSR